jgi:hypothetical protein
MLGSMHVRPRTSLRARTSGQLLPITRHLLQCSQRKYQRGSTNYAIRDDIIGPWDLSQHSLGQQGRDSSLCGQGIVILVRRAIISHANVLREADQYRFGATQLNLSIDNNMFVCAV